MRLQVGRWRLGLNPPKRGDCCPKILTHKGVCNFTFALQTLIQLLFTARRPRRT